MIRSLYSGVAGLKTQQTKMDVIGNNIANVGTYGFKSDRATFKDVYYQTTATASASTGNTGGTNAKQIGYGNLVGSIDTNTKTSAMSSTGYGLDIAIAGEGFLQVMGPDGNIMYTKAGMLDIDAEGNLVDVNGNFVLGVSGSDMSLEPGSNKIQVTLPYLDPQNSSVESTINNVDFTITSSNSTDKANVNFNFVSSNSLPIGQKMSAKISGDSITVTINAKETFNGVDEINSELNKAIKAANGNVEHPAGDFTISMVPSTSKFQALDIDTSKPAKSIELTGAELVSSNFGYIPGEIDMQQGLRNLFKISSVGEGFKGDTRNSKFDYEVDYSVDPTVGAYTRANGMEVTVTDKNGDSQTRTFAESDLQSLLHTEDSVTGATVVRNALTNKFELHSITANETAMTLGIDDYAIDYTVGASNVSWNDTAGTLTVDFDDVVTAQTLLNPSPTTHSETFTKAQMMAVTGATDVECASVMAAQDGLRLVTVNKNAADLKMWGDPADPANAFAFDYSKDPTGVSYVAGTGLKASFTDLDGAVHDVTFSDTDLQNVLTASGGTFNGANGDAISGATITLNAAGNGYDIALKITNTDNSGATPVVTVREEAPFTISTSDAIISTSNDTIELPMESKGDPTDFTIKYEEDNGDRIVTISMHDYNGNEYVGTIKNDQLNSAGDVLMRNVTSGDTSDSFVISYPSLATLKNSLGEVVTKNSASASFTSMIDSNGNPIKNPEQNGVNNIVNSKGFEFRFNDAINMTQSDPSRSLGLGQTAFKLTGGTEGGEQTVANLTSISINEGGHVVGVHDIYGIVDLGRIDLATFANPAGLQKVGNSYFTTSLNSGDPVIVEAGTQGTGQIMASTLEASNVDLSNEFSDMIMTQRGFQASSRVITVSDTMLEELINLKR